MKTADVVIIGGGPAGAAAALTLARYTSLKTVLLERGDYLGLRIGETIGPGAIPLLEFLGVANRVAEGEHLRARSTSAVWGSERVVTQDFLFTGRGDGWHLNRNRFDAMLAESAREAGATVYTRARIREMAREDGLWQFKAEVGDAAPMELAARFVIDASGRAAIIARSMGAEVDTVDQLVGIASYVRFDAGRPDHEGTTFVESVPEGWWYSTWLPGHILAVVFMSDADLVRPIEAHTIRGWIKLLSEALHTRERVVGGHRPGRLFTRDAASHFLRPGGGDGWLAAGDALSAFDPISSMGVGHALVSGANAARAVEASLRGDDDPVAMYLAKSTEHFSEYLSIRSRFYAMESRWAVMPFWRRRLKPALNSMSLGDPS